MSVMTDGDQYPIELRTIKRRKLLWCGDAACPSGFARATHGILDVLRETWDVAVLAIGYRGDPHEWPYKIYPSWPGGDAFGTNRLLWTADIERPDLILVQQDPWNIPQYLAPLRNAAAYGYDKSFESIPVVGAVAVDGLNCRGRGMNGLALGIFWTEFGLDEARRGGFTSPGAVVPLGVDLERFRPMSKSDARKARRIPDVLPRGHARDEAFIVGNVNRNQPRKRLDLLIQYFAQWVEADKVDNAYLYLHVAPTGDDGYDCNQLAAYYGVLDRLLLVEPEVFVGDSEDQMVDTYNSFDVNATTTQGEGFGLTTFEAMACGIPCIVPDWSALGELCKGAAIMVPCTSSIATHSRINSIGGVPDRVHFIRALHDVHAMRGLREKLTKLGMARAAEDRFRWRSVGEGFRDAIDTVDLTPAVPEYVAAIAPAGDDDAIASTATPPDVDPLFRMGSG